MVLDYMEEPDSISYNVMLVECVRIGEIKMAHQLFNRMPDRDLVS